MMTSWSGKSPALTLVCILLLVCTAWAENVNPDEDGSRYAWGENVGWVNAEPSGEGGPGAEVGDSLLTGFLWSENAGWVSLSCENSGVCGTVDYGVTNDGEGNLSGYAWSENAGWINFSCLTNGTCGSVDYGVRIDPDTGDFSGYAWSENAGFVRFASAAPVAYVVRTGWRVFPVPSCFLSVFK